MPNLRPAIHVCLVRDSAAANITPALDPAFKPDEVILIHSPAQQDRVDALTTVLRPAGITVSSCLIDDEHNIEHIRDRVLELLLTREGASVALNASGGTRPMSIGAYEIFHELGQPVFYVNPRNDRVTWLHRRDEPSFDLANQIKLPAFLGAHGATVENMGPRDGVSSRLRQLTTELVAEAEALARPLATLNWLAQKAERELISPSLSDGQRRWPEFNALLDRLAEEKVLELRGNRLHFASEEDRFFVNGGWLEVHVFGAVYGLPRSETGVQDVGRSVEVVREGTGKPVKNELDVAFLANNRLYIIECKTKRFHSDEKSVGLDTPGADTLYKLDTLKTVLGGARAEVMLVSFNALSRWDQQRAHDLDITLCSARELPRLQAKLRQWLSLG
jgi:hypothetical protein